VFVTSTALCRETEHEEIRSPGISGMDVSGFQKKTVEYVSNHELWIEWKS